MDDANGKHGECCKYKQGNSNYLIKNSDVFFRELIHCFNWQDLGYPELWVTAIFWKKESSR